MIDFITNTLKNIADFFVSVWNFIINLFREIGYMVKFLGEIVATIPSYFTWLPPTVLVLLLLVVSIIVIYKVIGREG